MKTIQLGGKTYQLAINFLTLIVFEREFGGNALDVEQFADHAYEATSRLAYAMIASNNDEHPTYNEIMKVGSLEEIANLIIATQEIYMTEMKAKPGDQQPAPKGKGKKKETEPKNE